MKRASIANAMELPLCVTQGYTRGGKKQLPYVSIWLDRLNHAQIHGENRGIYAAHIAKCLTERKGLLAALKRALPYIPDEGTEERDTRELVEDAIAKAEDRS